MSKKKSAYEKLNLSQRKFVDLYTGPENTFGHGTESYCEAYGFDITDKSDYSTAAVNASRLLKKAKILDAINEKLESYGLNDQFVDKQLLFLIKQNADLSNKRGAIVEYNKLKKRIEGNEGNNLTLIAENMTSISSEDFREFIKEKNKDKVKELKDEY